MWINNHESDSIVVNKGQIHGELWYFQSISSNSIKSDNELSEKLGILKSKTNPQNQNHRI